MQIVRHIGESTAAINASVVTLGNFDGVHVGHQALIGGAVSDARRIGVPSIVLTFEPHPVRVLAPERAPKLLLAHKDKMELLQRFGVDIVVVQRFDRAFAAISADEFIRGLLIDRLRAKKLWVGKDLRFGRGREGSAADLLRWSAVLGFEVTVVEPILIDGQRVSSSRIRALVEAGRVDEVKPLLGRYHFVSGRVIEGHRRGRDFGFPTANLAVRTEVMPLDGIYATLFHRGDRALPSVSSIGFNPTFGNGPRTVESYIMNFQEEIYGEAVALSFVKRLREEKKFASVPELVAQIQEDVRRAQLIFRELEKSSVEGGHVP